jgi:hypothetical protein
MSAQAVRTNNTRFEGEVALSTGQDQRLAGLQTRQGCHVVLPGAGLRSGNAHELTTLAFSQAWELRQREEEQPTGTRGGRQHGGFNVFDGHGGQDACSLRRGARGAERPATSYN